MSNESEYVVSARFEATGNYEEQLKKNIRLAKEFGQAVNDNGSKYAAYQNKINDSASKSWAKLGDDIERARARSVRDAANAQSAEMAHMVNTTSALKQIGGEAGNAASAIGGIASSLINVAQRVAVIGGTALFAGAVYGVKTLNSEMETTKIAIASIMNANGVGSAFTESMRSSDALVSRMRKDAVALPGELGDLTKIFRLSAGTGYAAGGNSIGLEKTAARAMAVGIGEGGMDSATIGRELSMLYAGQARRAGPMVPMMHIDPKSFNALAPAQRMKYIDTELGKHQGGIDAFQDTFEAKWSGIIDKVKDFGRDATAQPFQDVKGALDSIDHWFDNHKEDAKYWAIDIGRMMGESFDQVKSILKDFSPLLGNVTHGLAGLHLPKVSTVATLAAASAVEPIAGKAFSATTSAGAAVGGAFGMMSLGPAGAMVGSAIGSVSAMIPAFVGVGIAAGGTIGAVHAMTDATSNYHNHALASAARLENEMSQFTNSWSGSWTDFMDRLGVAWTNFMGDMMRALNSITSFGEKIGLFDKAKPVGVWTAEQERRQMTFERNNDASDAAYENSRVRPHITNHNTNIGTQNVSITVASNQDPGRIARLTRQELLNVARNAGYSWRNPQAAYYSGAK